MTYLATGKLDKYFNSTESAAFVTDLKVTLPYNLGNYPHDVRLTGLFKPDTVFVFVVFKVDDLQMSFGAVSLRSLVPERLNFASRDSATNGGYMFQAAVP